VGPSMVDMPLNLGAQIVLTSMIQAHLEDDEGDDIYDGEADDIYDDEADYIYHDGADYIYHDGADDDVMDSESSQNEQHEQQVLRTTSRFTNNTIWCHPAYGPSFGGNLNIFISSNSNKNRDSSINYRCPLTCRLLSFKFSTADIEVFHKIN